MKKIEIMKNEKGITLISLVIAIIIMIILAGIVLTMGRQGIKDAKDNKAITELGMVNHALLQRKTKKELTKEALPGRQIIDISEINSIIEEMNQKSSETKVELKDSNINNYYFLEKDELKELGITNSEYNYIVNYETGEVINKDNLVTTSGKPLYMYSVDKRGE